ncbi:adenylate/guanylate cyclase domain-containing protein [Larkinella sp. VNQ87]|uniref:adenylate/guanylate cyclase domain-containing protein n=1 Tax=Larkinella sp. VNQ87 TaxID=3400921 RepID=UPI003C03547C
MKPAPLFCPSRPMANRPSSTARPVRNDLVARLTRFLLLFFLVQTAPAAPIRIQDPAQVYDVWSVSRMRQVPAGSVSIQQLLNEPERYRFSPTDSRLIEPYNHRFGYWYTFQIQNETTEPLFLQFIVLGAERLTVFETDKNRVLATHQLGMLRSETAYPFRKSNPFCPLTVARGEAHTVYVYVEGVYTKRLPIFCLAAPKLLERQHHTDLFYGLYYGFILIIFVYNLLLFFRLREANNLRYALWVLFIGLQLALFRGHTNEAFWPANPVAEHYATALAGMTGMLHVLFTLSFLKLRRLAPVFYKIGLGVLGFYAVGIILNTIVAVLGQPFGRNSDIVPVVALLEGVFSVTAGIVVYRRNFKPALLYVLGNLAFYVAISIFLLYTSGQLPHRFWTYESMHLGVGVEIILFTIALTYRVNLLKLEREKAVRERIELLVENERLVREQNSELEERVRQRTHELEQEKQRSEDLLLNILPEPIVEELKLSGHSVPRRFDPVTVLFMDIKNFSKAGEQLSPEQLVSELDFYFQSIDTLLNSYRIEKIKTIGDAYLCAGGLPVAYPDNAQEVVRAALDIRAFLQQSRLERQRNGQPVFDFRIGIHSGPVVAGIVGVRKFVYDIWGDTVNIAARMEQHGEVDKVNISETTYQLVKNRFRCTYRGKVPVKNKEELDMYFAEESLPEAAENTVGQAHELTKATL